MMRLLLLGFVALLQVTFCFGQDETVLMDCPECPEMIAVPAGSFDMGAIHSGLDAIPVHRVIIAYTFEIGRTEVTQGMWKAIMGASPHVFTPCGDDCPVAMVSWSDVHEFIEKLNAKTGKNYRLPSEAEWEYSCRAGGDSEYCGSSDANEVAWYGKNAMGTVHPVAGKLPNALGIYDMSGNVWEWIEDGHHDSYEGAPADGSVWLSDRVHRVVRGGSWSHNENVLRVSNRGWSYPDATGDTGFRLARTLH